MIPLYAFSINLLLLHIAMLHFLFKGNQEFYDLKILKVLIFDNYFLTTI